MVFRVPLLFPVAAVIHRLDVASTRAVDPPGTETAGYDDRFQEVIAYDSGGAVVSSRQELAAIRVPCQVEEKTFEELKQESVGANDITTKCFVFHREDLEDLGLLDATTRRPLLGVNDRISALEKDGFPGVVVHTYEQPLYIVELKPRSWGMGPEGYDLHVAFTSNREQTFQP